MRRGLAAAVLLLGAVAPGGPAPGCAGASRNAVVLEVPFREQPDERCGPAAVAMVLAYHGIAFDYDELDREIHIPALGGSIPELLAAAGRRSGAVADVRSCDTAEVFKRLEEGQPLILLLGPGGGDETRGHFVVATGGNARTGALRVHSGTRPDRWWAASRWQPRWEGAGRRVIWIRPGLHPVAEEGRE